jgi:HAAS domain-containing protein
MSSTADKLVEDYLKRLNGELRGLPRGRRGELVDEISEHIAEARADLESENEAAIRTLLDRLGDPEEIAAEARERFGVAPKKAGWKEVGALIMLPIGGVILPVLGWFIGIVLLWISDAWSTRDKLVGTLLFPGGLLLPLALGVMAEESGGCGTVVTPQLSPQPIGNSCPPAGGTAAWEIALVVMLVLVPLLTTVYLARRMRRLAVATA